MVHVICYKFIPKYLIFARANISAFFKFTIPIVHYLYIEIFLKNVVNCVSCNLAKLTY